MSLAMQKILKEVAIGLALPFLIHVPSLDKLAIAAGFQSKAFLVQLGQVCSGRFPCKASPRKARLCPSAPATNSLKPWPALWPSTLAMKSQKPCSERWPLTAPLTQPRAALPTQPANRRRLFLCSYEGAARGESTKQRGQRARLPQSKAPAVAAAPSSAVKRRMYLQLLATKSLQPWPSLWQNACSKSLQPSAPRRSLQASSRAASRLRAKTPCKAKSRDRGSRAQ